MIVCLGEVVWDLLPGGPRLGGAPANVAVHAAALGERAVLVSRVGADELGDRALAQLAARGVDTSLVQRDPARPTGTVAVDARPGGEVRFAIDGAAAWSALAWEDRLAEQLFEARAICFGTLLLGAGGAGARRVLRRALAAASPGAWRLLDLNLRPPFDGDQVIDDALALASAIKINEAEAARLARRYGVTDPARWLIAERGARLVAVTRGEAGSTLLTPESEDHQPAHHRDPAPGADPVGAGDAFSAALLCGLLDGRGLALAHRAAARHAGFVASKPGATPLGPPSITDEPLGR